MNIIDFDKAFLVSLVKTPMAENEPLIESHIWGKMSAYFVEIMPSVTCGFCEKIFIRERVIVAARKIGISEALTLGHDQTVWLKNFNAYSYSLLIDLYSYDLLT